MEQGVDVVTHQKWSGANYVDNMLKMVSGGVSSIYRQTAETIRVST
jgi:isocitrate lyase